jgi:hypothetical protein
MIYSESCDQLYTLSYKEIAASEHEIFAPARTGQEIHGGNERDAAFKLEPKAMGPSRAKPVKSELSTPQSESHGGLHLSDIRCFKNVHLVLEADHAGQGGSLDTETNTKGINLQSRCPSRTPTVSSHPSFKSLIQDVAPIPEPTETLTRIDVTRSGENAPAENQRDASFEEDTNSFADTTASNLVPPVGAPAIPNDIHVLQLTAAETDFHSWAFSQQSAGLALRMPLTPPASDHGTPPASDHGTPPTTQECPSLSSQDTYYDYDHYRFPLSQEGHQTRHAPLALTGIMPRNHVHRLAHLQWALRNDSNLAQRHHKEKQCRPEAYQISIRQKIQPR